MKKLLMIVFSVAMLSGFIFSEYYPAEDSEKFEAKYYDNARVVRVKHTQGEAYIQRSYEEGIEEATANLPVFENDTAGTTDGRLELYLGKLNYIRLDYDTEVKFDTVPELRTTHTVIRLQQGGIYLDVNRLDQERDIEVQTPDCGVFILEPGQYRINVNAGVTEVFVHRGSADVAGSDYERIVEENKKIVMRNGDVRERPFYFSSANWDDFDSWNNERAKETGHVRYTNARYLDQGYEDYEYELSRNGRWRYSNNFNTYIWIPYNIGSSWRPYYHGRWVWNPHYGNVWSSYDSWGWYTHHYGRWHWDVGFGWHWIPGYRWSPAWVSWFWDDHYYGWTPLSWWNRPIVIYNNHWHRGYRYRHGVPYRSWSTIIIKKNRLYTGNVGRHVISKSNRRRLAKNRLKFRGGAPNMRPTHERVNVVNARGKSVVFKKNGLVTTSKYKVLKNGSSYKYSGNRLSKLAKAKYSRPVNTTGNTYRKRAPSRYSIKKTTTKTRTSSTYTNGRSGTPSKFKPKKTKTTTRTTKKVYKKPTSKSSRSYSSSKSSDSKIKAKKKKDSPNWSFNYTPSNRSYSSPSNSTSTTNRRSTYKSKRDYTTDYGTSRYKSSKRYTAPSYTSPSRKYKSSRDSSYKPSNRSYSTPGYSSSSPSYKRSDSPSYKPSNRSYSSSGDSSSRSYKSSGSSSYKPSNRSYSSSGYSSNRSYKSSSSSSYSSSKRSYSAPKSSSSRSYSKSSSSSSSRSVGSRSSSGRTYKRK
jgi:uncharacterized membrane protein YgcG